MLKHPSITRLLATIVPCVLLLSVGLQAAWAQEAGVVGTGTPGSCTEAAFDAVLAGGGAVTFNCGPNPATIALSAQKTIGIDTTIDGGGSVILSAHGSRHFVVNAGATLTLNSITLRDGLANGDGGSIFNSGTVVISNTLLTNNRSDNGSGGAIVSYGTLTIMRSTFEDNLGANGGAVYPRWSGSRTFVDHSIFRRNGATSATDGWGGAILLWDGAKLAIQDSLFEENSATYGGAIFNFPASSIVMTRTELSANTAQYGAGIYNQRATLTISDSRLRGNVATRFGGGIDNRGGVVAVSTSVLSDNSVSGLEGTGGAVNNVHFADILGALTMTDTTVSANDAGQRGGGIFSNGVVQLTRVTLDHNGAPTGGAIYNTGLLELHTSTLSDNSGSMAGALYQAGGALTVRYSTIADNRADDGNALHLDDVQRDNTSFQGVSVTGGTCAGNLPQSAGNNLENGNSCGFEGATDLPDTDPLLQPLANNGGVTRTRLPDPTSPVVDSGGNACASPDQRGAARPLDAACDIGAVEVTTAVPPPVCGGIFTASADVTLDPSAPALALGGAPTLHLSKQEASLTALLLRFAPGNFLPSGTTLSAAQLELHLPVGAARDLYPIEVRGVAGAWDEATVTWDSQPAAGASYSDRSYSGSDGVVRIDVTDLALAWGANARMGEIWLQPSGAAALDALFVAREQGAAAPQMVLICAPTAQAPFPDTTAADARQLADLDRLEAASTQPVTIEFGDDGGVRHAVFRLPIPESVGAESPERARWFVNTYKDLLRLTDPDGQLQLTQYDEANLHPRYRQLQDGIPVYPAELVVHLDGNDVVGLTGAYLPEVTALTAPFIDPAAATVLARTIGGPGSEVAGAPQLRYLVPAAIELDDPYTHLAWQISLLAPDRSVYLFIDAHTGELLLEEARSRDAFALTLWNGANMGPSSGSTCWNSIQNEVLWYTEAGQVGGIAPNADGQTAFSMIRSIYNFWRNTTGINRDSYRGNGNLISLYVNVGNPWANAQFNPTCDIFEFGAGMVSQDLVGHEFTHGVVGNTVGLIYQNQSGALDESFSDIFGYFVDNDDWTIGEASGSGAIRDLSNPPRFSVVRNGVTLRFPDRMSNFLTAAQLGNEENNAAAGGNDDGICDPFETCRVFDIGGVHLNSGIHNKVAYLLIAGGEFNGRTIRPIGQGKAQVLFYGVLNQFRLNANSTLPDARNAAVAVALAEAQRFLGTFNADDVCQVRNAFAAVELGLGDADCNGIEDTQGLGSDDDRDTNRLPNDNCPFLYNPGQRDIDTDGVGDACDGDMDADAICNTGGPAVAGSGVAAAGCQPGAMTVNGAPADNCPTAPNPDQLNRFGSPKGDACDDVDKDDVVDAKDNCPLIYQWRAEDWRDSDGDGEGDLCDDDLDGDFQPNALDNCPLVPNYNGLGGNGEDATETSRGLPADGVGDACDLCPAVSSADNGDFDDDRLANPCDLDDDNDAVCDVGGPLPGGAGGVPKAGCEPGKGMQNGQPSDNCPLKPNIEQSDFDSNGIGFVCDAAEADWLEGVFDHYGTRYPLPSLGAKIPIPVCNGCEGSYLPNRFEQVFKVQAPSGFRAVITDNFSNVVAQSVLSSVGQVLRFNPAPFALRTGLQNRAAGDDLAPAEVLYYLEFIPDETVDPNGEYEVTVDLDEGVGLTSWQIYLPAVNR